MPLKRECDIFNDGIRTGERRWKTGHKLIVTFFKIKKCAFVDLYSQGI